jgi:membrane protein
VAIKAILFDIDGTLVDSNDQHVSAWVEAFAGAGLRFDRQATHDQIGKGTDQLVPTLIANADEGMRMTLGAAQGDIFKSKYLADISPFPSARDS